MSERSRDYRERAMEILAARQSHPGRTPQEWMQFLSSLDAWYRSDRADCVPTLTSS